MSKQFTFYLTPSDSEDLKSRLRENYGAVFIADDSKQRKPKVLTKLLVGSIEKESLVLLVRKEDIKNLDFYEIKRRKIWVVDTLISPVIEFSNCYFDERVLGRGRMYCSTGYYGNDDIWITKNSSFLSWVDQVFAYTKKKLFKNRELDSYLGEETKKLYEEGEIRLSDY